LRPACVEVVADMRRHAEALLKADREWSRLSQQVSVYLRGMSLSPAENSRSEHEWSSLVKDLRRALLKQVSTPAPHLRLLAHAREEESRKRWLQREREGVAVDG
jgi:hypothetical protein